MKSIGKGKLITIHWISSTQKKQQERQQERQQEQKQQEQEGDLPFEGVSQWSPEREREGGIEKKESQMMKRFTKIQKNQLESERLRPPKVTMKAPGGTGWH